MLVRPCLCPLPCLRCACPERIPGPATRTQMVLIRMVYIMQPNRGSFDMAIINHSRSRARKALRRRKRSRAPHANPHPSMTSIKRVRVVARTKLRSQHRRSTMKESE